LPPVVFVVVEVELVVEFVVFIIAFVLARFALVLALFAVGASPQAEMPTARAATAEMVKTFNFMVF
jgi:hypothetical protein